jgi:hypothetical protein
MFAALTTSRFSSSLSISRRFYQNLDQNEMELDKDDVETVDFLNGFAVYQLEVIAREV